jgi:TonB-like protein
MRFFVPLLFASAISLAAQSSAPSPEPIQLSPQEAFAHRIGHDKPIYPRFALAAGVVGAVKIPLTIGPDGAIQQQGPIAGPPSLIASAQDWIDAGKFRPFLRDGQPVTVTTTLPVVFQLPPSAHSAHPLSALYQSNVTTTIEREGSESPLRARWSTLSPAMRDWLARYQKGVSSSDLPPSRASHNQSIADVIASENDAPPLTQMPGNIALYPVPLTVAGHRLYLLFEFSKFCAKTNCLIVLLEESPTGVRLLVNQLGVDVDLHRRHDSPYPDVLFWSDSGQPGISKIAGYSYYGAEWGQLYCGTDDAAEDSELDDEAVEHHGVHVPRPPLVTLCK